MQSFRWPSRGPQRTQSTMRTVQGTLAPLVAAVVTLVVVSGGKPTGTIMDMEHIVVFMQENRAFDHYCTVLGGCRGF